MPVVVVVVGVVIVGSGTVVVESQAARGGGRDHRLAGRARIVGEPEGGDDACRDRDDSASSAGQIQSPGYQPSRRRQAEPRTATTPEDAGSRWPHSRQYSWPSLYGVLQRGQRRSSC